MKSNDHCCALCKREVKSRLRDISWQAWSLLLQWHEVDQATVNHALCDACYTELRDVLIDRAEEVEAAMRQMSRGDEVMTVMPPLAASPRAALHP